VLASRAALLVALVVWFLPARFGLGASPVSFAFESLRDALIVWRRISKLREKVIGCHGYLARLRCERKPDRC